MKNKAKRNQRRLLAIFSADVVGYSRLMSDDEAATVKSIKRCRKVFTKRIQNHNGEVVDAKGDNLLAKFVSVVDAVECALDVQNGLTGMNTSLPDHRKMAFRIGVNLGDVIEEGGVVPKLIPAPRDQNCISLVGFLCRERADGLFVETIITAPIIVRWRVVRRGIFMVLR